jgi:hypothetical protein
MIPRLSATQFLRFMDKGKTSPALCACIYEHGALAGEYVVKLRGAVEGGETGLINELLAALLAKHFELAAPDPAIVLLDEALIDLIAHDHSSRQIALRRSVGCNFGTKHLVGVSTWPVDKAVPWEWFEAAVEIFAFDALLQNPDRRYNNPNLFTREDGLFIFDHETAFSFILDVLPQGKPWELERQPYLEKHVFYRRLKSKPIELERFTAALAGLSDEVLGRIRAELPPEWENQSYVTRIVEHLRTVSDHAEEFAEAIRRMLR